MDLFRNQDKAPGGCHSLTWLAQANELSFLLESSFYDKQPFAWKSTLFALEI